MNNPQQLVVKSADRALDVIEQLVHAPHGLSHSELALKLGIPKSSLTKLLRSLTFSGYVERAAGGKFCLGVRWRKLVDIFLRGSSWTDLILPGLERIVAATGETAGFNLVIREAIETIVTVISPHPLQYTMKRGDRAAPHLMSSGLVILAHVPKDEQVRYWQRILESNPEKAEFRTAPEFIRRLQQIRKHGYAQVEGFRAGIIALGVPVLSAEEVPIASLNIAVPQVRFSDDLRLSAIAVMRSVAKDLALMLESRIEPEPLLR